MPVRKGAIDFLDGAWDDGPSMLALSKDRAPLLGRATEIEVLRGLLDNVEHAGAALVLLGDPGIGKSRLLSEGIALAKDRQMNVLATSGVQSEARLAFGGLQQLLRPVRSQATNLTAAHEPALEAALGLGDDQPPEHFRIALAVLDLLSEAATDRPLLLVAEDAHWLDQPSVDVLGFVARRLESDPIVLLAAARDGYLSGFGAGELPELRLQPLDPQSADRLLTDSGDHLPTPDRARILREAAGNPLALAELPSTADRLHDDHLMPNLVPLTERLERAFAARAADLPLETQLLLLVAALSDSESLSEVLEAGGLVSDRPVGVEALQPAADVAMVDLDERTVRFRHPLMRSAVGQAAPIERRCRVHEALAEVLAGEPDRRVWHRAALIGGTHEDVATELEAAARRARRRGATAVAVTATKRAAELGETSQRGRRLVAAAELAFELGQPDVVVPLLREIEPLRPGALERARLAWIAEMIDPKALDEERVTALMASADAAGQAGDTDLQTDLIWLVVSRAWYGSPSPTTQRILREAPRRLSAPGDDLRGLAIQLTADPFGLTAQLSTRLRKAAAERSYTTEEALHLGPAAVVVGEFESASVFLGAAAEGLREEGRLGLLPRILALQATVTALLADWTTARPAADEVRRLANELNEPVFAAAGDFAASLIAGMRGDEDAAERAATRIEAIALPAKVNVLVAQAQFGRIVAALGAGRPAEAYELAERIFDPLDPAHHPLMAPWVIGDLAEAALQADQVAAGRERLAQIEATVGPSPGAWIALNLRHARAVLAEDDDATECFGAALGGDLGGWPYQRGRLLLAQGRWLRRRRDIAKSRGPLRSARDAFDALGCAAWADQARRELRASGESSRRRDPSLRDELTAQELQIAHLAAEGLSNREIGEKLFVSPRTVGTHLYRIYPKLGISARGELASVLETAS